MCPVYIIRLFDDVSSSVKLQNAVSEIVRWRLNTSLHDLWQTVHFAEYFISLQVSEKSLNSRACVYLLNRLTNIDKRCCVYFLGFTLLHIGRKISRNGLNDDNMDILSIILRRNFGQSCSDLSPGMTDQNTSELVEFLQKSAVGYLKIYHQIVARDFGSVVTIVTTDFVALYAYKRGDYQRCLQLSTPNVHTLLYAVYVASVPIFPEFIQLMDDDIVSLTALMLIINPQCTVINYDPLSLAQATLSLYLMTQCQLKLHHSVTSLARTLHYIIFAQRRCPRERSLNYFALKLIKRKICLKLCTEFDCAQS